MATNALREIDTIKWIHAKSVEISALGNTAEIGKITLERILEYQRKRVMDGFQSKG